jgi:hypothetical protein
MRKQKKAALDMLDFIRIVFMIAVAFFIYLLVAGTSNKNIREDNIGNAILDQMAFNSVSGFSYIDSNNRIHPGIVDLEKFDQDKSGEFISVPRTGGIKFTLKSFDGTIEKELFINKDDYSFAAGFSGGFYRKKTFNPVLIKDKDNFIQGSLEADYAFKTK